jgi:hypothetical protein
MEMTWAAKLQREIKQKITDLVRTEAAMTGVMAKVGNERRGFDRRILARLVRQVRDGKADCKVGTRVSQLDLTHKLTG